ASGKPGAVQVAAALLAERRKDQRVSTTKNSEILNEFIKYAHLGLPSALFQLVFEVRNNLAS
ncbi:MAG: hypothetical protein ORN49_08870, partial [Rhodobacteraceae bacterium]|nr:hypothetical protein [Paracoccaceae bacterium]